MQFSTAFLQSFFVSSCVCVFFLFSQPTLELVTFAECMPCVILKTRILFLAHYAHTHAHAHKRTNTNRRCELCCLLSPGLVHTRIPLAGATSRSPQSTTYTRTQHQLCAHSRYLALTSALSCSSLSSRLRHLIPYRRTLDALHVLHAIQVAATGNSSLA